MKKTKKIPNTPKYKFGGGFDSKDKANVRNFIGNSAKMYADTALNAVGVDAVGAGKGMEYKGTSANKFNQASNVTGAAAKVAAPMVANLLLPGSGQVLSMGQQVAGGAYNQFGPQNEQGFNAYDEQGNPIVNEGDKSAQVGQIVGQVGSMAGSFMGGSPGGMPGGATPAMVAKYGGYMKYAMGGMQYANGGTGEMNAEVEKEENAVGPNNEFTQFDGPSHSQGGIKTDMAPGTKVFSDKLKAPGTNKTFAKLNAGNNTNREDKLDAKEYLDPKSKMSIDLTRMAKMKNSDMLFAMQEQLKKDKVAAYAKRMGVELPSMDNEQMEPQGMPEQAEGEMVMARYGGRMNRMVMGGVQLPYYNTDEQGNPKYVIGGLTKPQYEQAQADSMNLYNAGLKSNKIPSWQVPGAIEASARLTALNKEAPMPTKGSFYGNDSNYTGGYNVSFQKPTMVPYNMQTIDKKELVANVNRKPAISERDPNRPTWDFNSGANPSFGGVSYTNAAGTGKVIPQTTLKYGGKLPKYADGIKTPKTNSIIMQDNGAPSIVPTSPDGSMANTTSYLKLDSNAIGDENNDFQWNFKGGNYTKPDSHTSYGLKKTPPSPPDEGTPFDWKDAAGQAANFIGQNAGNIYDLTRKNEPLTTYDRAQAKYLDPTQARKDEQYNYRQSLENVRTGSMGSGATLLANTNAARNRASTNTARINQAYDDANAQIGNQVNQYNTNISMQEKIAREANAAALENTRSKAIHGLGESFGKGTKSGKQTQMDQKELGMFQWRYQNEPGFKAHVDNFSKNNKGK